MSQCVKERVVKEEGSVNLIERKSNLYLDKASYSSVIEEQLFIHALTPGQPCHELLCHKIRSEHVSTAKLVLEA